MKMLEIINLNQKQCRLENKPFARDSKPQNYKTENSRDSKPQNDKTQNTRESKPQNDKTENSRYSKPYRMTKHRIVETVNHRNREQRRQ